MSLYIKNSSQEQLKARQGERLLEKQQGQAIVMHESPAVETNYYSIFVQRLMTTQEQIQTNSPFHITGDVTQIILQAQALPKSHITSNNIIMQGNVPSQYDNNIYRIAIVDMYSTCILVKLIVKKVPIYSNQP